MIIWSLFANYVCIFLKRLNNKEYIWVTEVENEFEDVLWSMCLGPQILYAIDLKFDILILVEYLN